MAGMKTLKEAQEFFNRSLLLKAVVLEQERQKFIGFWKREMKGSLKKSTLVFLLGVVLLISGLLRNIGALGHIDKTLIFLPFFYMIYRLITVGISFNKKFFEFQQKLREQVIVPFVKFIAPNLTYSGGRELEESEQQEIFKSLTTPIFFRVESNRELSGDRYEEFQVECSDQLEGSFAGLNAKVRLLAFINWREQQNIYDHSGGIYFTANLNKNIDGDLIIESEFLEKAVGGKISGIFDKIKRFQESTISNLPEKYRERQKDLSIIRFDDNEEFEKNFKVRGSDFGLARKVLTTARIGWLLKKSQEQEWPFSLSFCGDQFSIYFQRQNHNIFTLAYEEYNEEVGSFTRLEKIYSDISLLHSIEEGLNLSEFVC